MLSCTACAIGSCAQSRWGRCPCSSVLWLSEEEVHAILYCLRDEVLSVEQPYFIGPCSYGVCCMGDKELSTEQTKEKSIAKHQFDCVPTNDQCAVPPNLQPPAHELLSYGVGAARPGPGHTCVHAQVDTMSACL
eukprot:scaffold310533_cov22-Tisochrysis_lutea.AAC.1